MLWDTHNMKRRSRQYASTKSEAVEFRGIIFRRYPYAKQWSHRVYYTPHAGHRKRGVGALHQEVWKWNHGPIPDGHEINHIDGDPLNNAVENLECITKADHDLRHKAACSRRQRSAGGLSQLRAASDKARDWHKSEAGREWHRRNGRLAWKKRERVSVKCEQCGEGFETHCPGRARFCSQKCRQKSYRADGRYANRPYVKDRKR
jgi:hypothetical protein